MEAKKIVILMNVLGLMESIKLIYSEGGKGMKCSFLTHVVIVVRHYVDSIIQKKSNKAANSLVWV